MCITADLWIRAAAVSVQSCPGDVCLSSVGYSGTDAAAAAAAVDLSSRITDDTSELVRGRFNGRPTSDIYPSSSSLNVTSIIPII